MIPQANITAWCASVPWADDTQVEQDLALSRAVAELFADDDLASKLALRGGTALTSCSFCNPFGTPKTSISCKSKPDRSVRSSMRLAARSIRGLAIRDEAEVRGP